MHRHTNQPDRIEFQPAFHRTSLRAMLAGGVKTLNAQRVKRL
jgi:hypothetical protein